MPLLIADATGESFSFDGVLEESHKSTANVTKHPVENLLFVSDHRQQEPTTIQVNAVMTGTPFLYGNPPNITELFGDARLQSVKNFFDRTQNETLYTYVSLSLGRINNLALEDVTYDLGAGKDNLLNVAMNFTQIQFGRTEVVDLPPIQVPEQEPTTDQGEQPGEEVEDEIEAQSWLDRLTGSGRGLDRVLDSDQNALSQIKSTIGGLAEGIMP